MEETILIAEDDSDLNDSITAALTREGYRCISCLDPVKALEAARREDIDLLLTDLKMPNIDGVELANRFNSLQPDARVIMMTGYSTMSTVIEGLRMGIDSYILKPFRMDVLHKTVHDVAGRIGR